MKNYQMYKDMLKQVVTDINTCLDQKEWTAKQLKKGMEFVIHEDWFPLCSTIIKKYRGAGWIVKLNVEVEPGRRQYILNIRHPQESAD